MPKAIWNGVVLAESEDGVVVEGNYYFPKTSINCEYFQESSKETVCHWKGTANYYDIVVDGEINAAAAWYYEEPFEAAKEIKDHIAFWGGVEVK